jgi:hypothetical protein
MRKRYFACLPALLVAASVVADSPTGMEVTCEVDRSSARVATRDQTQVTFRLWTAETGGTQCGLDQVVTMPELTAVKEKRDRYDGVSAKTFWRMRAVLPTAIVCPSSDTWIDVQIGTQTFTCDFGNPTPQARRKLQAVPFAQQASGSSGVPSGAMILWDSGACPSGFSLVTLYNDRFLVSSPTAGSTGGSNTHSHGSGTYSGSVHTHSVPYSGWPMEVAGFGDGSRLAGNKASETEYMTIGNNTSGPGGGGAISGTSDVSDGRPSFVTLTLCRKD